MGFWGWRQSAVSAFLSVLVTACAPVVPAPLLSQPATSLPIALTVEGISTSPPIISAVVPVITIVDQNEGDPAAVIDAPLCSETRIRGWQCLGLIHNTGESSLGALELVVTQGELSTATLVGWGSVLPGEAVPYRFLIESVTDPVQISLNSPFMLGGLQRLDADYSHQPGSAEVVVSVNNANNLALTGIRVVLTVSDDSGLRGFRSHLIEHLTPGQQAQVAMDLGTLAGLPALTLRVVAEGWHE